MRMLSGVALTAMGVALFGLGFTIGKESAPTPQKEVSAIELQRRLLGSEYRVSIVYPDGCEFRLDLGKYWCLGDDETPEPWAVKAFE